MKERQTDVPPATAAQPSVLTVLLAVIPPMFIAVLDAGIVSVALPAIVADLGGFSRMTLVVVVYLAANAVAAPVFGRLGDALGRRRMLSMALVMMMLGSAVCAASVTFEMLIAGRLVQGFGAGGLMALSQALLGQSLSPQQRARYQGHLAAAITLSSAAGPVLGALISGFASWRWIFALNVPLGLLALVAINRLPPRRTPREDVRFDYPGLAFFAMLVGFLVLAVEMLKAGPAQAGLGLALCAAAGGGALALLVRRERRAPAPLFPGQIFGDRSLVLSYAMALLHGGLFVSMLTFIPTYLVMARGVTPTDLAQLMLPVTIALGIGAAGTGRLIARTGRITVFPATAMGLASVMLLLTPRVLEGLSPQQAVFWFTIPLMLMGTVMVAALLIAQSVAERSRLGIVSATVMVSRSLGAAFGAALSGLIFVRGLGPAGAQAAPDTIAAAFGDIFFLLAAIGAVCALAAASVPHRRL